jgi:dihydrofolate reductase
VQPCVEPPLIFFIDQLPWKISRDLKFFSRITKTYQNEDGLKQNAIVMGRKTWESIGKKPLPGRLNIVLSSDTSSENEDALEIDEEENTMLVNSLDSAIQYCEENEFVSEIFVIGGARIYAETGKISNRVKNVFHTRIGQKIKGDTKLSKDLFSDFEVKEISKTYSENGYNFDFVRMINPQLYPQHHEEYSQKVFNTQSGEYAYIDLVDDIIRNGKSSSPKLKV